MDALDTLKQKLFEAKEEAETLTNDVKNNLSLYQVRAKDYNAKLTPYQNEAPAFLDALKRIVTLLEDYSRKENIHNTLVTKSIQIHEEYKFCLDEQEAARQEYNDKTDEINNLLREYNDLRNTADPQILRTLKEKIDSERSEVSRLSTNLNEKRNQTNTVLNRLKPLIEQVRSSKSFLEGESAYITGEQKKIDEWKAKRDEIKLELDAEKADINKLKNYISSKTEKLNILTSEIAKLEKTIKEFSDEHFKVPNGQLTFDAEGNEGGVYHSRVPHVPGETSGVTIGRGYDLKERTAQEVIQHLKYAGFSSDMAQLYSQGVGLSGNAAREFIGNNKLEEITSLQQKKLFIVAYDEATKDVLRICAKPEVVEKYGKTDWPNLNKYICDVLIDLRYRGDYHTGSRRLIQKHVANNDIKKFSEVVFNRNNWLNVPLDRFNRRVNHLRKGLDNSMHRIISEMYPAYGMSAFSAHSIFQQSKNISREDSNSVSKSLEEFTQGIELRARL